MKRKIGELRNKPIVEGDRNLLSKNEIHINEVSGGGDPDFVAFYSTQTSYNTVYVTENKTIPEELLNYIYKNVTVSYDDVSIHCDTLILSRKSSNATATLSLKISNNYTFEEYYMNASGIYLDDNISGTSLLTEINFPYQCLHVYKINGKTIAFATNTTYLKITNN